MYNHYVRRTQAPVVRRNAVLGGCLIGDTSSRAGETMPFYENGSRRARGPGRQGFTLAEVLVVVAVITLLVAILLPSLNGALEQAKNSLCKSNLYHIAQTLHANTQENAHIASGYNWIGVTLAYSDNSRDMVWCPSDTRNRGDFSAASIGRLLQEFYILQFHTGTQTEYWLSPFPDIFGGKKVPDPQVWCWYPKGGVHDAPKGEEWPAGTLPTLKDNQAFIGVDNDGAVLITFGADKITFENWKVPDSSLAGYSRQYVSKGAGTPPTPLAGGQKPEDADDKMIIELYGWDNKRYGDKVSIDMGAQTSYGINGLVEDRKWRPDQYLVMDANELVIDISGTNKADLLDEVLVPRHGGKLNVSKCDGSVVQKRAVDMEMELTRPVNLWTSNR
jgi:prepilin-type N-terminal cleavage/methylation domain-containing protein/prepilin-type processing-associated H-X9-DG protein